MSLTPTPSATRNAERLPRQGASITQHSYEGVNLADLRGDTEESSSYCVTSCSAYGVSLEYQEQ